MARGDRAMKLKDYEYFRTDLGVLYKGDCLEILPLIDKVDLVLTDPPYGIKIGKQSQGKGGGIAKKINYGDNDWDDNIPDKAIFDMILKTKNAIICGGNYFVEYLNNSPCWLVWDKKNGKTDFADCELIWTNFKTSVGKYEFKWSGMLQENMKNKEKRFHPTQKPVMLFYQILEDYSEDNMLILDPFLGSGTTAIACEKLGRRWIGIEISEKYCEIARQRIKAESDQFKMF
jgi:DNA modification methylase